MVPDGTYRAASMPTRSANASCSALTVGSSPYTSSPTSASAIARRISGVGRVTVSERRSTRPLTMRCEASHVADDALLDELFALALELAGMAAALVGTGFAYQAGRRAEQAEALTVVLPAVRDIRRAGAAAVDLCWVACGRLDAYFEVGRQAWDVAAGSLIATEAGAVVIHPD